MGVFEEAYRFYKVDLSRVEAVGAGLLTTLMTELGSAEPLLEAFRTVESFASWNGLCPDNRITGGRMPKAKTRAAEGRVAQGFRLAAHKLARVVSGMINSGRPYDEEKAFRPTPSSQARRLKRLREQAAALGMQLLPAAS